MVRCLFVCQFQWVTKDCHWVSEGFSRVSGLLGAISRESSVCPASPSIQHRDRQTKIQSHSHLSFVVEMVWEVLRL
jgi:hypothetical protein